MTDNTTSTPRQYLTAENLVSFIREQTGLPITKNRLTAEVAAGTGPITVGRWRNRRLFDRQQALDWARSKVTPHDPAPSKRPHNSQSRFIARP
jgi:hypothetical protein